MGKRASLVWTRGLASRLFSLRNGEAGFAAADQKVRETVFLPSTFKTHLSMKNKHRENAQNQNLTAKQSKRMEITKF